jgi:preprotein translocase subunit SecD
MRIFLLPILFFLIILFSCQGNINKDIYNQSEWGNFNKNAINSDTIKSDSTYLFTGFYFASEKGQGKIMKDPNLNKIYKITTAPFVSVKNIIKATVEKSMVSQNVYNVKIVLDKIGTKDLEEGTGNPLHPYMAVIFTNKLIYVVENKAKIKSGIVSISLADYSEQQVNKIVEAINQKK